MLIKEHNDAQWQPEWGAKPTRMSVLADMRAGRPVDAVAQAALLSPSDMVALGLVTATGETARQTAPAPAAPGAAVLDRVRARVERNRATAADARAALLAEIQRKHGTEAANAAQNLSLADLVKRAGAPTRAAISASWSKAFQARSIAVLEDDPNETPIQQSWTRALRRCGANIESNVARPAETDKHGWSKAMARHGASL
jgi:hypothetical protein